MNDQAIDALTARVRVLERRQRLTMLFLALTVVSFVTLAATAPQPTSVAAEEFLLKDHDGAIRARLGLSGLARAVPPPARTGSGPQDMASRLMDKLEPAEPQIEKVSTSCLTFFASDGHEAAEQCTSWETPAETSLAFRVGRTTQYTVHADVDSAQVVVGQMRRRHQSEAHPRVSIVAGKDVARLTVAAPPNRAATLKAGSLTIEDGGEHPPRVFPPVSAP